MSGTCTLGSLRWRIEPSDIKWDYQIDAVKIDTLGGQVVQVLGATLGDLTVSGYFGQSGSTQSWQLAEAFQRQIKQLVDRQTLRTPKVTLGPKDASSTHAPIPFRYHDDVHDWNFQVLIKSLEDLDGSGQLSHSTGKFSYGYTLTLFIVESATEALQHIAIDTFIQRLSSGVGWKLSKFNGPVSAQEASDYIKAHGGSIPSYLEQTLLGQGG